MLETAPWPPVYTVRKSKKAKNILLKISGFKGLEVVVPYRIRSFDVETLLNKKRTWIEQKLNQFKVIEKSKADIFKMSELPLRMLNQSWKIEFAISDKRAKLYEKPNCEIMILGATDKDKVKKLTIKWLKEKADKILISRLHEISTEYQLPFTSVSVGGQRTLWGSCSEEKAIRLNYKLLFLPEVLTTHIMKHELCHTIHLNHSPGFWRLLGSIDSNYKAHDRALKKAHLYVPGPFEF